MLGILAAYYVDVLLLPPDSLATVTKPLDRAPNLLLLASHRGAGSSRRTFIPRTGVQLNTIRDEDSAVRAVKAMRGDCDCSRAVEKARMAD